MYRSQIKFIEKGRGGGILADADRRAGVRKMPTIADRDVWKFRMQKICKKKISMRLRRNHLFPVIVDYNHIPPQKWIFLANFFLKFLIQLKK